MLGDQEPLARAHVHRLGKLERSRNYSLKSRSNDVEMPRSMVKPGKKGAGEGLSKQTKAKRMGWCFSTSALIND